MKSREPLIQLISPARARVGRRGQDRALPPRRSPAAPPAIQTDGFRKQAPAVEVSRVDFTPRTERGVGQTERCACESRGTGDGGKSDEDSGIFAARRNTAGM